MEDSLKYEEPKLIELDALLLRGAIADNASNSEMMASFEDDDVAHETMEF